MAHPLRWRQADGLELQAEAGSAVVQAPDAIRQMLPGQLQFNAWCRGEDHFRFLGVVEQLGLQGPASSGTGPIHQGRSFALAHRSEVLPFLKAIPGARRLLFSNRARATARPDQLRLLGLPSPPTDEQPEWCNGLDLHGRRQLPAPMPRHPGKKEGRAACGNAITVHNGMPLNAQAATGPSCSAVQLQGIERRLTSKRRGGLITAQGEPLE